MSTPLIRRLLLCSLFLVATPVVAQDAGTDGGDDAGEMEDAGESDGGDLVDAAVVDGGDDAGAVEDAGAADDAGPTMDSGTPGLDGGGVTPDGDPFGADACPGVDSRGRCDGTVLTFCQAGVEESIDCADDSMTCGEVGVGAGFQCVPVSLVGDDPATPDLQMIFCDCASSDTEPPAAAFALLLGIGLVIAARRQRR
jgi:MYXO-CTERM domain-containing protein